MKAKDKPNNNIFKKMIYRTAHDKLGAATKQKNIIIYWYNLLIYNFYIIYW